jgi:hypothetical protein
MFLSKLLSSCHDFQLSGNIVQRSLHSLVYATFLPVLMLLLIFCVGLIFQTLFCTFWFSDVLSCLTRQVAIFLSYFISSFQLHKSTIGTRVCDTLTIFFFFFFLKKVVTHLFHWHIDKLKKGKFRWNREFKL